MFERVAHVEPDVTVHERIVAPARCHPLADLFPLVEGEAYRDLVEDVRANGVREPIVMLDGMILDGRHRYLAAREAGVPWPTREFEEGDPLAYVVSINLKRRHLSTSQRAMIAAKIANLAVGSNQYVHKVKHDLMTGEEFSPPLAVAARSLSIDRKTAGFGRAVLDRGTPALIAAVEAGAATVSAAAEVAKLPETLQAEVVAADAVAEVAAEVRHTGPATVTARLKAGDPKTRAEVQGAIKALATGNAPRSPAKPAPPVVEDPAFAAMSQIAAAAEGIAERLAEVGPDFVVGGFLDAGMKRRNVETFTRGRDALNQLLEACDAA